MREESNNSDKYATYHRLNISYAIGASETFRLKLYL